MPMQPSPIVETLSPLRPSSRVFILAPILLAGPLEQATPEGPTGSRCCPPRRRFKLRAGSPAAETVDGTNGHTPALSRAGCRSARRHELARLALFRPRVPGGREEGIPARFAADRMSRKRN